MECFLKSFLTYLHSGHCHCSHGHPQMPFTSSVCFFPSFNVLLLSTSFALKPPCQPPEGPLFPKGLFSGYWRSFAHTHRELKGPRSLWYFRVTLSKWMITLVDESTYFSWSTTTLRLLIYMPEICGIRLKLLSQESAEIKAFLVSFSSFLGLPLFPTNFWENSLHTDPLRVCFLGIPLWHSQTLLSEDSRWFFSIEFNNAISSSSALD